MMMVVAPSQVLTSRTEQYLWPLFPISDMEVQQSYLQRVNRRPLGCFKTGRLGLRTWTIWWDTTI